jgi:CheY-like chemotaxis protein
MTIVKTHGGFLDFRSRAGKGTTFDVYLPRGHAKDMQESVNRPKTLSGKGETVMVVDDDPGVLQLTGDLLTHYGYKVVTAKNGADAIALYAQHKDVIKMVVMDMMMPVMDGASAIKVLKKQQPRLGVLATSGLAQSDKLKDISGFDIPFLSKPYPAEKLLEQLRSLLQPAKA